MLLEKSCEKMSRSFKKHPIIKDNGKSKKKGKKIANRKVRRSKLSGRKSKNYKKYYESWNVYDFRFYRDKEPDMDDEYLNWWKKMYYRK